MSRSRKQRTAANTAEASSMSTNEKILKECHDLYVDEEKGGLSFTQFSPSVLTLVLFCNHL